MSDIDANVVAREMANIIPLIMRHFSVSFRSKHPQMMHTQFRLLMMLSRSPCNLSALAEKQSVSLPTMSNTISTLVERGWVDRTRSTEDRRKVLIEITPAGQEILDEAQRHVEAHIGELLSPLSQEERQAVLKGLKILRDAFASAPAHTDKMDEDCN